MLKNQSHAPVHRRRIGITLAIGVLVASAIAVATPAVAAMAAEQSSLDAAPSSVETAAAAEAVTAGRTALTDAATAVVAAESSGLDLGDASTAVDTSGLLDAMDELDDVDSLTALELPVVRVQATAEITAVTTQTAELHARQDAAAAEKQAAEAAAAAAEAEAAALANANTPDGARASAAAIAAEQYGWGGGEFECLNSLWQKESGWNYQAYNADGGATGIPQALPGSKMASAGADWATNATTQIRWGLDYIQRAYGSPCSAWGHSQSVNWY
ncbi:phospholipase [Microbacterium sp. TWP3-1-2b2]|uniref:aggregation-promoting factor C-terminal-like domain-containing protein n=1 Tax=Microbacterium sp. TWP3-1-2b2 TaxID=2804651 RepID=UPI003CF9FDEA